MGQMHCTGQAVTRAERRKTHRREVYTNRIRKGINRIRIRIGNSMCLSGGLIEPKLNRKRNARIQLVGSRVIGASIARLDE
jgi:hypothetical protein